MDNIQEAITLQNVSFSANGTEILHQLNGGFPAGNISVLVGPSGAGKSTLFRLLNGMRSADKGEIYIHGKNIAQFDPTELRRTVGIALQQAPMLQGTVWKNLSLPRKLQGKELTKEEAQKLLRIVNLDEQLLDRKAKELSGGQKQRLSIARTLVNQPPILLLDEITSSLDQVSAHEIEKLIIHLNQAYQTTIIWITHSLEQARKVGDYAYVMMNGKIVESGNIDLLTHPSSDSVKNFIKGDQS